MASRMRAETNRRKVWPSRTEVAEHPGREQAYTVWYNGEVRSFHSDEFEARARLAFLQGDVTALPPRPRKRAE